MENKIRLTKDEIIMGFVASCVEDVADTLGVDCSEVYQRMDAVKMIDEHIIPNYEVLHSESHKNVTIGLIDTLKRWEEGDEKRAVRNIIRWQRISCIVVKISETLNVSLKEALDLFYRSETCRRFHDEETGLYLQGNLYVLNDFLAEISRSGVAL